VTLFIVLLTFADLFLEDLKVAAFPREMDTDFIIASLIVLIVFSAEVLLNCIVTPKYLFGIFFWLDIVSALSLLPDVPWLWLPLVGLRSNDSGASDGEMNDTAFELDRIVRVSQTGEHLLKAMRFMKLLRLGRIAKLFEVTQRQVEERSREAKREATRQRFGPDSLDSSQFAEPTQLGAQLAERTTRKVVALVLAMLILMPLLKTVVVDSSHAFALDRAHALASNPILFANLTAAQQFDGSWQVLNSNATTAQIDAIRSSSLSVREFDRFELVNMLSGYSSTRGQPLPTADKYAAASPALNQTYVQTMIGEMNSPLAIASLQGAIVQMDAEFHFLLSFYSNHVLYLRVRGSYYANDYLDPSLFDHRPSEMLAYNVGSDRAGSRSSLAVFSVRDEVLTEAQLTLIRTALVLVLLTVASVAFNLHNHNHVVLPIGQNREWQTYCTFIP
jgi:hypothetical protein